MMDAFPVRDAEASSGALEQLYEFAPCGYVSTTADGTIIRVNQTFLTWTGFARDELIGKTFISLLSVGSQLFYETRYLAVLHLNGEAREVAFSLKARDGSALPILVNAMTVLDADGRPSLIRTAIFDSTARQNYERDLLDARRLAESSEQRVRMLQDASATFVVATTESALADELARSVRESFAATHVSVQLLDEVGELTEVTGQSTLVDHAGPAGDAVRSATAVTLSRKDAAIDTYPGLLEALRAARIESLSVVPIMEDGRPLGVVTSYFGRARTFDTHEIDLQLALARQAAQLLNRIRLQRQLEQLALYDQLTGLANRKLLRERFTQTLAEVVRNERDMALIFLDLDGFKAINDEFGHSAGDEVLVEIGRRMVAVVRTGDMVGRFGGDEFVIICEDADADAVESITDRLRDAVRQPLSRHPSALITASIGVALLNGADVTSSTVDRIFDAADEAMYESKRGGKNRVTVARVTQ
jgi:diguanylate cyclase (GGDEF)-like protein/PAS domain S-box-containing protein